jgi:hypothetical protein
VPGSNVSLVITITLSTKDNFHTAVVVFDMQN